MAEYPMFPLWTDAYLGDTMHLTCEQHGAYLLLLISMWRSKDARLPDNDAILGNTCRLGPKAWARMRVAVEPFFVVADGWWTQSRLLREREAAGKRKAAQSGNAKSRWNNKTTDATAKPRECPPSPSPSPSPNGDDSLPSVTAKPPPEPPAEPPPPTPPPDLRSVAWQTAEHLFGKQGRGLLGKAIKDYGEDVAIAAMVRVQKEQPAEPRAFFQGCLRAAATTKPPRYVEGTASRTIRAMRERGLFTDDNSSEQPGTLREMRGNVVELLPQRAVFG